ncbi:MAG: aminoglycoside phosphotransferase family protein [Actinomycetia bacterium]|nr:aminoglycoside phosphotransferase family protein [Actinomycetes bacterium]
MEDPDELDELERVARSEFGLNVAARLPITDSFSSTVLSFIATDNRHYVLKRHWARNKAQREASALRALNAHPHVPALLSTSDRDDTLTLLIEGLDATPWLTVADAAPELLRHLGHSIGLLHQTPADSFDGMNSWHALLISNADRYAASIGANDRTLAEEARDLLGRHLSDIPASPNPSLVHFDLRPGNILVRDGRLVGIIDFESCRGGHPSMDFFKLWQQVHPHLPDGLADILHGYRETTETTEPWTEPTSLDRLMQIYAAYHGLAGLGWCHTRNDLSGDFPAINRNLIHDATAALE